MAKREETKRVGIWIRVSTEDQVRGESPETHERRARPMHGYDPNRMGHGRSSVAAVRKA